MVQPASHCLNKCVLSSLNDSSGCLLTKHVSLPLFYFIFRVCVCVCVCVCWGAYYFLSPWLHHSLRILSVENQTKIYIHISESSTGLKMPTAQVQGVGNVAEK